MEDAHGVLTVSMCFRHSHATHDLFNYIGTGKEAVWNFYIQTMDIAEGDSGKFGFDPLDCTKVHSPPARPFVMQMLVAVHLAHISS